MSSSGSKVPYRVLPLPRVQREAKKLLTSQQLHEGIQLARRLRRYPDTADLSIEAFGEGMELRIESPAINKQGWLRAIFWVHPPSRTIYIVDLFWKKTNAIATADRLRARDRITRLRRQLTAGDSPWGLSE
jgi:phage-related protein